MALQTDTDTTNNPEPPTYPAFATPPRSEQPRQTQDKQTTQVMTGGASIEALGGAAAIVLAIIGLAGYLPFYMAGIATLAIGGALLVHGVSVAARWRQTIERLSRDRKDEMTVSGGVGIETLGGACGVALGILALAGILPGVLLSVAAIVLGGSLLLAGPALPELARLVSDSDRNFERTIREAMRATSGADMLLGAGAVVLGILALLHIGPALTLVMVSMLALGIGALFAGGALAVRFGRELQHA